MANVSGGRLVGIIMTMGLLAAGTSCTDTPTPPTVAGNPPFPVTPAPVGVSSPATQVSAAPTSGTVTTPAASSPVAGSGVVTTLAGSTQGFADGTGTGAKFDSPDSVVVDSSGNIFVADTNNDRIRQITPAGVVTTVVGGGPVQVAVGDCTAPGITISLNVIGSGGVAKAGNTAGLAREGSGNLLTSPDGLVLRITPGGAVTHIAGIPGGPGFRDGNACNDAEFASTSGIAVDTNGAIYVADVTRVRKISGGQVTSLTAASFARLRGMTIDKDGNLYVVDSTENKISKITPAGVVTTVAGAAGSGVTFADGTGTAARFAGPSGIAADSSGNLYVADSANNAIRKVTATGVVTTVAGQTGLTGILFADGTGTAAHFLNPEGVALDGNGNLIVADTVNHRIRKVTL